MDKEWKLGLICGRFSHAHNGHVSMIDKCISLCQKTLILVGSANESKTLRNPFCFETRANVLKNIYSNVPETKLMIRGINDLKNEYNNSNDWGKYLKSEVERYNNRFADLIIYGNRNTRIGWFAKEDLVNTDELILNKKTIPVSATLVRGFLLINDELSWQKVSHKSIYGMYKKLRDELLNVPVYFQIYRDICSVGLSIENFMQVYKKFEEEDKKIKLLQLKNNI